MPLYDYACNNCGYEFETNLKVSDRHKPTTEPCPECGKLTIDKQINMPQNSCIDPFRLDGRIKHNDDFRETMRYIKNGNPGNKIKDY